MEYRDYYATLGVPRTATQPDIKKAFRKLARKHHPDVNASDSTAEARFKEINEAYDVLGDAQKRALYDQLGTDWEAYQRSAGSGAKGAKGAGAAGGFPGGVRFEYAGDPADLDGFSEFFRTFFASGMGGAPGGPARAPRARGGASGSGGPTGSGGRRPGRSTGGMRIEDLFGAAGGAGGTSDPAATGGHAAAHGGRSARAARPARAPGAQAELEVSLEDIALGATARVQVGDRRLEVTIPKGIDTGGRIRLSGKAPDGGDLTLIAKLRPHPVFTRAGADVTRELPITLGEALLGTELPVGTPAGRTLLLTIPAGTQNGRQFRLRGHGLPRFKAEGSGDLLVKARVVLPAALDEEGQRLARQLVDHIAQPDPREGRSPAGATSVASGTSADAGDPTARPAATSPTAESPAATAS